MFIIVNLILTFTFFLLKISCCNKHVLVFLKSFSFLKKKKQKRIRLCQTTKKNCISWTLYTYFYYLFAFAKFQVFSAEYAIVLFLLFFFKWSLYLYIFFSNKQSSSPDQVHSSSSSTMLQSSFILILTLKYFSQSFHHTLMTEKNPFCRFNMHAQVYTPTYQTTYEPTYIHTHIHSLIKYSHCFSVAFICNCLPVYFTYPIRFLVNPLHRTLLYRNLKKKGFQ